MVSRRRPGPGTVLSGRRGRSRLCPRRPAERDARHDDRSRFEPHRARRRRRGRRHPARRPGVRRSRDHRRLSVGRRGGCANHIVAKAAAKAGVDGLAFLRGVPGSIGGAVVMNAGAHSGEIKDALIEANGLTGPARGARFCTPRWAFPIATVRRPLMSSSRLLCFRAVRAIRSRLRPRWSASPAPAKPRSRFARRLAGRRSRTRRK